MDKPKPLMVYVKNEEILQRAISVLSYVRTLVVDTETNGLRPYHGDRVVGVAVYAPEVNTAYYFPIRYP